MKHLAHRELIHSPLNAPPTIEDRTNGVLSPRVRPYIAIIGAGYGMDEAPYEDPDWEVWGLNVVAPLDRQGRLRCDRWFELHEAHAQSEDDMTWIAACPVPIYVPPSLMDASPNAVAFPLAAIERVFGGYWACTFAYQIALALYEGVERIGIYGAELAYGDARERSVEWACVSWWLGFAEARGVTIHAPERSRLGQHPYRYGFEYDAEKRSTEKYLALFNSPAAPKGGVGG